MSIARSFQLFLLSFALVGAWIPAAMIALPASEPTAAAPDAPAEIRSVADEAPHASVAVAIRAA